MITSLSETQLAEMAQRVGRETARQYPGVDAEDITSEALTRLYEKAGRIGDAEAGYIYRVLERDASAYAAKVRYDRIIETCQYVYTPREVKALLEHAYFDPAAWDVPSGRDDWLFAEVEERSLGISLMDLKVGMERIKPQYRSTLERRYFHGDDVHREEVARAADALTRAVNRIASKTGVSDEGPGSRQAVSNEEARHMTAYEGGGSGRRETDALAQLQKLRKRDRSDPPGTHFDWDKRN